jgi:DNA-binding beta-propeller fold protein YncE
MSRRTKWARSLALGTLALAVSMPVDAQSRALAENIPEIPMQAVPGFFKLPDGLYFGEGIGIATNSQGHIFVYHRSGDTRLFEFDGDGNFIREIGQGLYGLEMAHKVRVDDEDNIWVVDEGANLVLKFNPEGRVVMVLGHRPEASDGVIPSFSGEGPNEKYLFARPTDVTWDQDGNIFVSDGYFNHRVVKYSPEGFYMGQVGTGVRGPGRDELSTPHTIASDDQGNIYVGDRGNARVKVYDSDLNLLRMYENVGNPWEICISRGEHQYLFVSNSNPDSNPAASWDITGEVYKMELDGTIIGRFGRAGKEPGQFQTIHGLDCRDPNELYISEISAWRAQKILLADRPVS